MIELVDAPACFEANRHQAKILSFGSGEELFTVSDQKFDKGGRLSRRTAIFMAITFRSENALGQARLPKGTERLLGIAPMTFNLAIRLKIGQPP